MKHNDIIKELNKLIAEAEEHIRKHDEHIDKVYMDVHGVTYAEFKKIWDEVGVDVSDIYESPQKS